MRMRYWCVGLLLLAQQAAALPTVEVLALFSNRAMLRIDGQQYLLKAGDSSPEGVVLVSATGKSAVIEVEGKRTTVQPQTIIRGELKPVQPTITHGASSTPTPLNTNKTHAEVIISADINNQYLTTANINGQDVKVIVDTGANTIAMSSKHARDLAIDNTATGMVGTAQTASGTATMTMVKLNSVKIGDIEVSHVDAAILDGDYPETVLLGMSFLNQVHLVQEKGVMKITQKIVATPAPTGVTTLPTTPTTPPRN